MAKGQKRSGRECHSAWNRDPSGGVIGVQKGFIRVSGAAGDAEVPTFGRIGHAAWRTRLRSRSNLARPYMLRLSVLSRLT